MSEYSKKLYISKGGNLEAIPLYTNLNEVSTPALRLQDGTNTVFAKLGTETRGASSLKCSSGGTSYSVINGNPLAYPNNLIEVSLLHFNESTTKDECNFITWSNGTGATLSTTAKFGKALSGIIEGTFTTAPQFDHYANAARTPLSRGFEYFMDSNDSIGMWVFVPSASTLKTILTADGQMLEFYRHTSPRDSNWFFAVGVIRVSRTTYEIGYAYKNSKYSSTPIRVTAAANNVLTITDTGWHHLVIQNSDGTLAQFGLDGNVCNVRTPYVTPAEIGYPTGGKITLQATNGILIDEFFMARHDNTFSTQENNFAMLPFYSRYVDTYTVPSSPYV